MNDNEFRKALSDLTLGELRYFDTLGSTNDEALAWATQGAPDLSLVIADEQTAGRGRFGRKWFTPAGAALAFSLIFRPSEDSTKHLSRTVGLAALAVVHALDQYSAGARIKWPNDILLLGRKIAGILVESVWTGDEVDCQVIGVGLNLRKDSVPEATALHFPATSLEQIGIASPAREQILHDILKEIIALRANIGTSEFITEWENHLAYRGEVVHIEHLDGSAQNGLLVGLEPDGSLRLRDDHGNPVTVQFGDVSLRPPA